VKILTVVGARPQFIKAAAVSRCLRNTHDEVLVHTGQHYDDEMSGRFFRQLDMPVPDYSLEVGSGSHGAQTGRMLERIEEVIVREQADVVLVYGDTNSTLAGALAAAKLHVPVAHVEAGLRSFNRQMPEEINRVMTDHLSGQLFCPTQVAADNLAREGISRGVHIVGDVMADAFQQFHSAVDADELLQEHGLERGKYLLATVHRAENVDDAERLKEILSAFDALQERIVFPTHPRVRSAIQAQGFTPASHVSLTRPVGYFEMLALQQHARLVLTDSGGVQKEAFWSGVPCVTLRDETEWVETVQHGWNTLVGAARDRIIAAVRNVHTPAERPMLYPAGAAAAIALSLTSR
jgi:UDP-N-acetylglucosamine 2-epimerase